MQTFLGRNTVHQKKTMSDSDMPLSLKSEKVCWSGAVSSFELVSLSLCFHGFLQNHLSAKAGIPQDSQPVQLQDTFLSHLLKKKESRYTHGDLFGFQAPGMHVHPRLRVGLR